MVFDVNNYRFYLCHCQLNAFQERIIAVTMVQSETELIHILLQILHRDVVEYAIHRPFQNRPTTFNAVGVLPVTERVCHTVVNLNMHILVLRLAVQYAV